MKDELGSAFSTLLFTYQSSARFKSTCIDRRELGDLGHAGPAAADAPATLTAFEASPAGACAHTYDTRKNIHSKEAQPSASLSRKPVDHRAASKASTCNKWHGWLAHLRRVRGHCDGREGRQGAARSHQARHRKPTHVGRRRFRGDWYCGIDYIEKTRRRS